MPADLPSLPLVPLAAWLETPESKELSASDLGLRFGEDSVEGL